MIGLPGFSKEIIITGQSPGTGNTSTRIELDASASAVDGAYDPALISIYAGKGAGQGRTIYEYDGTNKYAYINRDWKVIPDSTSKYMITFANNGGMHVNEGLAQAGGNNTITLNSLADSQNSIYLGQIIFIVAGTGMDQAKMCIGYNGTTKVATLDSNWITNPDATSIYVVMPFPGFIHGVPSQNSAANILMRDVIGSKDDIVTVPHVEGITSILGFLHTGYYHAHGKSFSYPDNADDVLLTSGSGAWSESGDIIEVIPANALDVDDFDLHWINISNISANATIQIDIFAGAAESEVRIGSSRSSRSTNQSRNGPAKVQIPQRLINTRISCRVNDSTSGTITVLVSFEGHYYMLD
jgi:hypothetical protein